MGNVQQRIVIGRGEITDMVKRPKQNAKDMIRAIAVLLKNTTWKCGRVERLVVNYMRDQIRRFDRARTPIIDMLQYFNLKGKQKNEFFDAIRRLEKRRIIKIEGF